MNSKNMGRKKIKEVLQLVTCRVNLLWNFGEVSACGIVLFLETPS